MINLVNVRLEHFYGEFDDDSKFTSNVIRSCLKNEPLIKLTAGEQKRDFVYIDDVISALCLIIDHTYKTENSFEEYEVGSGESISIKDFVQIVKELTKSESILDFGAVPYRKNEDMELKAKTQAIEQLGWSKFYNLETGLKKVIDIEKGK